MDSTTAGYLKTVCDHVHLNPVRAKLVAPAAPLKSCLWNSLTDCLNCVAQRFAWLRVDRLLGEHGIPEDSPAGRRMFAQRMEERWQAEE